jgi:hypothetical protein
MSYCVESSSIVLKYAELCGSCWDRRSIERSLLTTAVYEMPAIVDRFDRVNGSVPDQCFDWEDEQR